MKKRLRKKLRVKEFFEPYIEVDGTFGISLSDVALDMYIDNLCHFVDQHNISYAGAFTPTSFTINIFGMYPWRNRLKETHIQLFLKKYYHSSFIKGEHTVKIYRKENEIEVLVFKGWADYAFKL